MLSEAQISTIQNLLAQARNTLNECQPLPTPSNYASILKSITWNELRNEQARLSVLFAKPLSPIEEIKEVLRQFCLERDESNQNTTLSFRNAPTDPSNLLYWSIVWEIFTPKTLSDMLAVISPRTKWCLSFDLELQKAKLLGEKHH